ncbi:MAG: S8 family peptidase [Bacteroidota bacterium]|nr:S8 family peptidase [Bacteroidota bacterium]
MIAVSYFGTLDQKEVVAALELTGARVLHPRLQPRQVLFVQAGESALEKIAALPFVSYVSVQHMKPGALNLEERAAQGVDALNSSTGRNLQGDGITLGMGDNADPFTHVDFTGRLIDRYPDTPDFHGTHTTGTAAGGGILDPRFKGMAPHATIVSQFFTDILVNSPIYIADYNMVLTNDSYDDAEPGCTGEGEYDILSNYIDDQLTANPHLQHVFAAGNDGFNTCNGFPLSFGTVKSGFQCAKNTLVVGNFSNYTGIINPGSSRGPVNDGRVKPEIVAGGSSLTSTYPFNTYGMLSGTSMSAPAVTGSMALLYQRYRQLHGGADPPAALIKAITCNSATDVGNPGPDFTYGFGMLNARAAVEAMENNQYFTGTLSANGTASFTIPGVGAGAQQVKIMLYWADPAAAPFSGTALVNDLDLTVMSPDAILHHPMVLNPAPTHVNDPAAEGPDHLNNIEQVVVNNPAAGSYSVTVSGSGIATGSQDFVVVYQVVQPSVVVESPYGDETLVPGTGQYIRWSAFGGGSNPFTIEYSTDNGGSWTTLSNSVPAASRSFSWFPIPAVPSSQCLVRITRNSTGISGVSHSPFTILGQPVIAVSNPCQGYAQIGWAAIPGASSYDVMQLKGDSMQVVANTSATSYLLGGLNRDSSYWLSVRALLGVSPGSPGMRSLAATIQPSGGACSLAALNNDLSVDSLLGPSSGRMFSSSQLSGSTKIAVEVRNLGTVATGGPYSLSYRINGGSVVTETPPALAGNTAAGYTFLQTADLSAPGTYTLQVWVTNPGDPQAANDTLSATIKQLQNDPITLNPSFTEGFESATAQTYIHPVMGIEGDDRCDFAASNANGRARPFINTGFARTGNRCLTLDQIHYSKTGSTADSLVTTYNLSGYTPSDQVWLDFYYQNQGIDFLQPGNRVWIRGNDQAAWLPVYTLDASPANIGVYQPSAHIDVTGLLKGAVPAQSVSSSFQVKFGEQGFTSTNSVIPDGDLDDGYSFDDITLTRATNDVGVLSLISPDFSTLCGLSNAETISVSVKNYSSAAAANIPVSYSINGSTVTETIPSIAPFDSIVYTFAQKADLSAFKAYSLSGWVSFPGDSYRKNDTLTPIVFQTTPLITSFPYLEGFEKGTGNWYSGGINDTWQWGSPGKTIINRAANGLNCWVTNLTGDYNSNELSYLYSPCFDLSSLDSPMLSFSHIFRTEDACDCDYHWVEYSTDGRTWVKLGATGSGTNWYDNTARQAWQKSDPLWHVSSFAIPSRGPKVRFRIVMYSDPATTFEGVGIDDIHLFDKASMYSGTPASVTQAASGNGWIDFSSGGRLIASINPLGQYLGQTKVGVFINNGPVRNDGTQYELDRNIVIQPAHPPTDSVAVRYYFLDSEANNLIAATGCPSCARIHDAYQAGVMQYSTPAPAEEDSSLLNDNKGTFHFLPSQKGVTIVPYDNGYYAEYYVSGFSEFWINTGTPGPGVPYPLALLSFTATKNGNSALLAWSTTGEKNSKRYVIEKSRDANSFAAIDSVPANGTDSNIVDHYQYTDTHLWNGINYYRLRMVTNNGPVLYSPVRSVTDTLANSGPGVYPNPVVGGILYVGTSVNCQSIRLMDASGRTIRNQSAFGLLNTVFVPGLATGIYFVDVRTDDGNAVYKIFVK